MNVVALEVILALFFAAGALKAAIGRQLLPLATCLLALAAVAALIRLGARPVVPLALLGFAAVGLIVGALLGYGAGVRISPMGMSCTDTRAPLR